MKFIKKLIGLIPVKLIVKHLPDIIGFIITRALKYIAKNYPDKLKLVGNYAKKIIAVSDMAIEFTSDNVLDANEIKKISEAWKEEFKNS